MTTSAPEHPPHAARWVAAMLVSGVGLAGLGYSIATRPTPAPAPAVFVAEQIQPRTAAPLEEPSLRPAEQIASSGGERPKVDAVAPDESGAAGLLIDLNSATPENLELLPGIGPARARAIVMNRETLGPFRTIDDLERVPGIGPATVEGLRPFATLESAGSGG